MNIGRLRQRVTIQQYVASRDSVGDQIETWGDVAEVWADVRAKPVEETFIGGADREQDGVTYDVSIRYRSDVDATNRLLYDGRALDILGTADPTGRRRELRIICEYKPDVEGWT